MRNRNISYWKSQFKYINHKKYIPVFQSMQMNVRLSHLLIWAQVSFCEYGSTD